jgi:hypothetical protein
MRSVLEYIYYVKQNEPRCGFEEYGFLGPIESLCPWLWRMALG